MSLKHRRMRFEALESRELLSVTDVSATSSTALVSTVDLDSEVEALSASLFEIMEASSQVRLVTTAKDVVDPNDGVTSLREALAEAQNGDVVRFADALGDNITIVVTSQFEITKGITIEGEGRVTFDGGNASRIFNSSGTGTGERFTLSGLVLQNGSSDKGGAIYNNSKRELILTGVTVRDCVATSDGGAINNEDYATLTIKNSEFYGNSASQNGGVIYNDFNSTLTVESSAFYGNTAKNGGAIYNYYGTCTISNSTIAGNSASRTSGAIYNGNNRKLNLANTIVAQNFAPQSSDIYGTLTSNVNNIIGNSPDFVVAPYFNANGELQNLDSLDLRLRSTSSAIDAGDDSYVAENATDLDDNARLYGQHVDIGAYEYQGDRNDTTRPVLVDTLEDAFDFNDGKWSLREALWFAQDGTTIRFTPTLQGVLTLNSSINISAPIVLDGGNAVTIDCSALDSADGSKEAFVISGGTVESPVTLKNITIANTRKYSAILNNDTLELDGVTIRNCVSTGNGGAINNEEYATLTIKNSEFYGNSASQNGGVIYNGFNSTLTVESSAFYGNTAKNGGTIYNYYGTCTISNSTIAGNSASRTSGAIYNGNNRKLNLANTIVAQNFAPQSSDIYGTLTSDVNNILGYSPNFVVAPEFNAKGELQNLDTLDLRLRPISNAIDAGDDSYVAELATDVAGNERIIGEHVDIGAYEYTPSLLQARIKGITQIENKLTAVSPDGFTATSYQWFVSDTPNGERTPIDGATDATYTVARAYFQKYITVVIQGECGQSDSCFAKATTAAIAARKLLKPTLKTEVASDSIVVSWKSVLRAQGYYVYYKTSADESYTYYGKVSDTQCELQGLDPSTTYSIRVKAIATQKEYLNSDYTTIDVTTNAAVEYVGPARNVRQAQTVATSIQLAWNSGENADSYRVDVYNAARTQLLASYETTETSVKLTDLTASTSYSVDVVARSTRYGEAATVTFAAKTDAVTKLAIPTVKTTPGSSAVFVSWNSNKDAVAYLVQYKVASSTSSYTAYGRVYGTSFTLEGLRSDTVYSIRVKAIGDTIDHNNSDWRTVEVQTAPAISVLPSPENVAVTGVTAASVSVCWNRVIDASSYRVTVYTNDMSEVVASYSTSALSATLSGLAASTNYRVTVVGVSSRFGESAPVELAFTTAAKQKLARPSVSVTADSNSLTVNWAIDPEAYKYRVQYRKVGDSAYTILPDFFGDSYTLEGLEPGTSYQIGVKAFASSKNPEYVTSDFATVTKKTTL